MHCTTKYTNANYDITVKLKSIGNINTKGAVLIFGSLNSAPCLGVVQVHYLNGAYTSTGGFIHYVNYSNVLVNELLSVSISSDTMTITLPAGGVYGAYELISWFDVQ